MQSQIRSLARQRGKAERHVKLSEEKFAVQVTLARRLLDRLRDEAAGMQARFAELAELLPAARQRLHDCEQHREAAARGRAAAETRRTEIARRLGTVQLELGKLDGDLALAAERLANTSTRRQRAEEERRQMELRAQHALVERDAAARDHEAASGEHERIRAELGGRADAEEDVRRRLGEQRAQVREWEQALQAHAQTLRSLEGERAALEGELASLRERAAGAAAHRRHLQGELAGAERRRDHAVERAGFLTHEAKRAAAAAEHARHLVAEAREQEALHRSDRRRAEEALAQLTARRHALEELERDRVGLAPAAAALLAARDRFDGAVLGPLSDFVTTSRDDAELAERLLGDWMHAVLVRDHDAVRAIQAWHADHQPGSLVLLPLDPGPHQAQDGQPLDDRLRAEDPAAGWLRVALAGSEVLDTSGRVLRRASGAIFLSGAAAPSGPLRRRAELSSLAHDVEHGTATLAAAETELEATIGRLAEREASLAAASAAAEQAREAERQGTAARDDALRIVGNLAREMTESETAAHPGDRATQPIRAAAGRDRCRPGRG